MSDDRWRALLKAIPGWHDPYGADSFPNSEQVEAEVLAELRQHDPFLAELVEKWIKAGKAMSLRATHLLRNVESE